MNYLVKNAQGEILKLVVVSGVPQLPEGMELVGEESIINPLGLDHAVASLQIVELEPARSELVSTEVLAVPEVLYQAAVLDVDGITVLTPEIAAQPAIPYQAAVFNNIPAVLGLRLVEDSAKILVNRQNKANDVLNQIRSLRAPLLEAVDKKINIAEDDGVDTTVLRAYRKELRNCTDVLKKVSGDAKLSCENMVANEFIFPSLGV